VIKVEIILGIVAASIAILGFMARAYANIRRGRRIKRYSELASTQAERELERLREEYRAAGEMTERRRKSSPPESS
jgi:hypothetical protein